MAKFKPKADPIKIAFGKRLRTARIETKYTQERFAELTDISVSFLNQLERGIAGPSLATLKRIQEVLHVSLDYLVSGQKENNVGLFVDQLKYLDPVYLPLLQETIQKQFETISFCEATVKKRLSNSGKADG